jgi:hypothetical protein
MNILMLGRWVPPVRCPVRGTREYQFARYLARSHQLTLAFVTDNRDSAGPISVLRSDFGDLEFAVVPRGWQSLFSALRLVGGESCTLSYSRSEALRTRLADRVKTTPYGLVFVTSASMIQYALEMDPAVPVVVDFGDVESEWWRRQSERGTFPGARFFHAEATRLRLAEAASARRASRCFVATATAAAVVRGLAPEAAVTVLPTGLDPEGFGLGLRSGKGPTIVFNGSLADDDDIQDLREFCRTVLPRVRARVPGTRLVVTGRERAVAARMPVLPEVELVAPGTDALQHFHAQTVAVAPLRAAPEGRDLLVEPMAAAVPVVATAKACEQLGARAGHDLQVADDPAEFALQVIGLLESEALRRELGDRGRQFVETNLSWDAHGAELGKALADIIGGPARPASAPPVNPLAAAQKR